MRDKRLVLTSLISEWAAKTPDRVFMQEVGGPSLTYRQYDEMIRTWAGAYRRLGVAPGDRVVAMLPASIKASCAWLGLALLRAIEVPCNTAYRGRMLGYLAAQSEADTMVISDQFLPRLVDVAAEVKGLRNVVVIGDRLENVDGPWQVVTEEEFFTGVEPAVDLEGPTPSDICALFYTSGTTGPSKGVLTPWAQLYTQATGAVRLGDLNRDDAFYMPFPIHHVTGKTPIYWMVLVGGRVVIRDRFETGAFWSDIDEYRCTTTALLGGMPTFLWQQPRREDDPAHPLKNVWMAPLVPYLDEFKTRFGVRVATSYASVEQGPAVHVGGWDTSSATWKSCGRLRQGYPGFEVRIVDGADYDVPCGAVGELIVRSSEPWTMSVGYYGMPDKTVEAWRNGWFHTGDAFTCDEDGNYYFVDRVKDCIRRRGENISSFEVEAEVNSHPDVIESAAIGVPSQFGEEEVKVLVVRRPGSELKPEELIHFLIPRMPRFMVPRYVEFVAEVPKTEATMRVKKYLLRETAVNEATWDREQSDIELPR